MATLPPQKREVHHTSATYTFASRPRPVQPRARYRNKQGQQNDGPPPYGNIMYDRRIVRGNTYAQNVLPASVQPDPIEIQKEQEARRRILARKKARAQLKPKTPEAVEGRRHIDVQTELYLEELTDRVEEADVFTQTDAFLDRPPSPLFIPAKTGVDVATQILEGELFDFDIEVKPILEVLVGKTVEQALLEVMEEEELANLRAQQRRFEEMRNAELVETQRLEEQERRHREEKERRMQQQTDVRKKEKETSQKIAARAFAQSYLQDLVPSVFGTLSDYGYFFDPVERDVENHFMPWLMGEVETELDKTRVARALLDGIIRETVTNRDLSYAALEDEVEKRVKAAANALRVSLRAALGNDAKIDNAETDGVQDTSASDNETKAEPTSEVVDANSQGPSSETPAEQETVGEAGDGVEQVSAEVSEETENQGDDEAGDEQQES